VKDFPFYCEIINDGNCAISGIIYYL